MSNSKFFTMLGTSRLVTPHNIPYALNLQHPCCENLKFCTILCEISDFFHFVVEVVALLGCYSAFVGSCIAVFWDNLSVQSAREGQAVLPWKKGSIEFFKNFANKYHPALLNNAEEIRPFVKYYFQYRHNVITL